MVSTQVRTFPGPESACELSAMISNYVVRDAILADDVIKKAPGQFQRVNILPAR